MNIHPLLLETLACPDCHARVHPEEDRQAMVCEGCGKAYPVVDDIPVMLVDEAR